MHPSLRPFAEYFSIPEDFGPDGGLIWTKDGDAIEEDNGQVFIFAKQLADFIEGFAAIAPVLHFGHMLELWHMLGLNPPKHAPMRDRFHQMAVIFREPNTPVRNVGAFFARQTTGVGRALHVPPGGGKALSHFLTHSNSVGLFHPAGPGNSETPDRPSLALWNRIASVLKALGNDNIRHFFRHGGPPVDAAPIEQIVEVVDLKPPSLPEFLDEAVKDRARLRRSVPMVRQLVAALSLPPRRRNSQKLPVGGYADVTNRGRPERLLPSQFALDPDDFVRRFAEQELLYFQKEDPHERERETLTLVLDQGVRTWGAVRQTLAASLLAFGKMADTRQMPLQVRFTSAPGERFAPPEGDVVRFGNLLEASDLTPHPAVALAEEVNDSEETTRDIVLLTHPATLTEPAVLELPELLPENHRLFALTVTEEDDVELVELRPGGTVSIKRLRMLPVTSESRKEQPPAPVRTSTGPWTGDVEPAPFPFRLGPIHGIEHLCFDATGEHLLLVTKHGYLYLVTLATKEVEMLPRGYASSMLIETKCVAGVRDGFVVGGMVGAHLNLFHYRLSERSVTRHQVFEGDRRIPYVLTAFPDLDCVVVKHSAVRGVDLGSGAKYPQPDNAMDLVSRAQSAVELYLRARQPILVLPTGIYDPNATLSVGPWFNHSPETGEVIFRARPDAGIHHETPLSDGKPVYRGANVQRVLVAGETMAVASSAKSSRNQDNIWRLIDIRDGRIILEIPFKFPWLDQAVLSLDGGQFAFRTEASEVTVHQLHGNPSVAKTPPGYCHTNAELRLTPRSLGIVIGKEMFRLDWHGPELQIARLAPEKVPPPSGNQYVFVYDGKRFYKTAKSGDLEVMLDVFGQIILRRKNILAVLLAYQGHLCFWMPDGTRFGPANLTGGPPTPDAKERLRAALRIAE